MIWLGQTTGDHTFQELLDLETKPKDVFELPSWIDRLEHLSREKDEAAGVRIFSFRLDKEGEYFAGLSLGAGAPGLWFCSPTFQVLEADEESSPRPSLRGAWYG